MPINKNIQSCLLNKVGLRGLCDDDGTRLMINNLPGIHLEKFANVADSDSVTGSRLFNEIVLFSEQQVINDLVTILSDDIMFSTIIKSDIKGGYSRTTATSFDSNDRVITICQYCDNDPYVSVKLEYIEMMVLAGGGVTKTITIEVDDIVVNTIDFNFENGANRIYINQIGKRINVKFDSSGLTLTSGANNCSTEVCSSCFSLNCDFGLQASASCVCDNNDIFCKYVDDWKMAALYHIGIQLHLNNIGNDSKNPLVRNTKDDSKYWLARWEGTPDVQTGFNQTSEYWRQLKASAKRIKNGLKKSRCNKCIGYSIKVAKI